MLDDLDMLARKLERDRSVKVVVFQSALEEISVCHADTDFLQDMSTEAVARGIEGWDCYGRYLHTLERIRGQWQITRMTLVVHGQKGNLSFLQQIQM